MLSLSCTYDSSLVSLVVQNVTFMLKTQSAQTLEQDFLHALAVIFVLFM